MKDDLPGGVSAQLARRDHDGHGGRRCVADVFILPARDALACSVQLRLLPVAAWRVRLVVAMCGLAARCFSGHAALPPALAVGFAVAGRPPQHYYSVHWIKGPAGNRTRRCSNQMGQSDSHTHTRAGVFTSLASRSNAHSTHTHTRICADGRTAAGGACPVRRPAPHNYH